MKVKITKIAIAENPIHKTVKLEEYTNDLTNEYSPPVEYWITGELTQKPEVGQSISVIRDCRNGVKTHGFFRSSPVMKIDGNKFYTFNSIYTIENLN